MCNDIIVLTTVEMDAVITFITGALWSWFYINIIFTAGII